MDAHAVPESCKNCGAPRQGLYCHACGQRYLDGPLGYGLILSWLVQQGLNLERGFLLTLWEMTVRPGALVRRYLAGERQRFMNPFAYFAVGVGISTVVAVLVDEQAAIVARVGHDLGPLHQGAADSFLGALNAAYKFPAVSSILFCIPMLAGLRLFFRRAGLTSAELWVFLLFLTGQVGIFGSLVSVFLELLTMTGGAAIWSATVVWVAVFLHAGVGLFGRGLGSLARLFGALAAAFLLWTVVTAFPLVVMGVRQGWAEAEAAHQAALHPDASVVVDGGAER